MGEVLRRHKGSLTAIADSIGIRQSGVSQWIAGRTTSARIFEAAEVKVRQLLELEKQQEAAKASSVCDCSTS